MCHSKLLIYLAFVNIGRLRRINLCCSWW